MHRPGLVITPLAMPSLITSHQRSPSALHSPSFDSPLSAIPDTAPHSGGHQQRPNSHIATSFHSLGVRSPLSVQAVGAEAASSSPQLPAIWRGISQVVPLLRAMLRQTRISTALVMVMSAISLEAGEVWKARRQLKQLPKVVAAGERSQRDDESDGDGNEVPTFFHMSSQQLASGDKTQRDRRGTEEEQQRASAQLASLLQHVASLRQLFLSAPDGQPEEAAVMALLSDLKASHTRVAATEDPSAASRRRRPPRLLVPSSSTAATAAILGQLELQALRYLRAPEYYSTRFNTAAGAIAAATSGAMPLKVAVARHQKHQQVSEFHAEEYLARLGVALHGAPPRPPPLQPMAMPAITRRAPGGMKARRQAQAQVDEGKWEATSGLLA